MRTMKKPTKTSRTNNGVRGELHLSPTSHSCLATNKQILLKDEIKQIKLRIEDNGYWGV